MNAAALAETPESLSALSPATNFSALGPRARATLEAVRAVRDLPAGWDGYGSPSLTPSALRTAAYLVTQVEILESPPHVAPVPGGGIQLEWTLGDRELEIEVTPEGDVLYLLRRGSSSVDGWLDRSRWIVPLLEQVRGVSS